MTRIKCLFLFGICMTLVAGCASSTRRQADDHSAYRTVMARQIVSPETGEAVPSTPGFDGKAAQITIDRYREQFSKPPPRRVFAIPIGGIQ